METDKPELRGEDLDEILGRAPNRIIRSGITVVALVVALIIAGSYFFKYPETVSAPISLVSDNAQANIVADGNSEIISLFVVNRQKVKKDQKLALLEICSPEINPGEDATDCSPEKNEAVSKPGGNKPGKRTYLLKSPADGIVLFPEILNENTCVNSGDTLMTVVYEDKCRVKGRLTIPAGASWKIKTGQKVIIRLDGYPYMEFGTVNGILKSVSSVPPDNKRIAEVELPDGLKTCYGFKPDFIQQMQGSAVIITNDLRLIERFLKPVRDVLKK